MNLNEILITLFKNISDTSIAEYVAVFTGLLSVWFAKKENILVYPIGIINVSIYVFLCYNAGLYADMGINVFYFFVSIYGWFVWSQKNKNNNEVRQIGKLTNNENLLAVVVTIIIAVVLYFILVKFTDSTVPYLDSFTTAIFITGMYLMAIKKTENWIYWIIGDMICIFLFTYKGLVLSGFQYLVFLILAISGFMEWNSKLKAHVN
jgi:nicotinamide mononucleotide transporter